MLGLLSLVSTATQPWPFAQRPSRNSAAVALQLRDSLRYLGCPVDANRVIAVPATTSPADGVPLIQGMAASDRSAEALRRHSMAG